MRHRIYTIIIVSVSFLFIQLSCEKEECTYEHSGTIIDFGGGCGYIIQVDNTNETLSPSNWNQFTLYPYDGQRVEFSYFDEGVIGNCPVDKQVVLDCIREES